MARNVKDSSPSSPEPDLTADDGRSIVGTVRELIFQGSSTRLELVLADGTVVVAQMTDSHELPHVRPGNEVYLRWSPGAAYLHLATTMVRRAERSAWAAIATHGEQPGSGRGVGGVNRLTATYLNRLSDLLFILARVANVERGGDVLWQPGGGRVEKPERKRRTSSRGAAGSEPESS